MVAVTRLVRLVISFNGSGKDNEPQLANDGFSFLFGNAKIFDSGTLNDSFYHQNAGKCCEASCGVSRPAKCYIAVRHYVLVFSKKFAI